MKLFIVGIGPGGWNEMTLRAQQVIEASDVVAGYGLYIDLIRERIGEKEVIATGMRGEVERCRAAVETAVSGKTVAVISSGDAGVYGMAGLCCQLAAPYPALAIEVVPGVTAACSASAVLGAPLTHDFATVSLSDLLTEWAVIEKRLRLAAEADFVICIYNPASHKRKDHLARACTEVRKHRAPHTPCGLVRNIGREGESYEILTLEQLQDTQVDMFTTVIIGNSNTQVLHNRLVTPRGYQL